MRTVIRYLIKSYQYLISPWLPSACRFYPSCSEYALEAFEHYGIIRGFGLTCYRLLRCNPWCQGGNDPLNFSEKE